MLLRLLPMIAFFMLLEKASNLTGISEDALILSSILLYFFWPLIPAVIFGILKWMLKMGFGHWSDLFNPKSGRKQ